MPINPEAPLTAEPPRAWAGVGGWLLGGRGGWLLAWAWAGAAAFGGTADRGVAEAVPFGGMAGQSLFCNFWIVGFERDSKKQPNITFEVKITDENDKPTLPKAMAGEIKQGVSEDWQLIPMNFILPLNRPGKFTVHLKATDGVTKKTAELKFPITVVELK